MKAASVMTLLGLALVSGALVAAFASSPGDEFARLDRNGDARLSPDEAAPIAGLATHFSKFDRDGNGVLDRDEFSRHEQATADQG